MKPNRILLTLITAALLPAYAHASTDAISDSSEFGSQCSSTTTLMEVTAPMDNKTDAMENTVNAWVNSTDDPVSISYYLDWYHAPAPIRAMEFSNVPDPYLDAVTLALFGPIELKSRHVC